MAVLKLILSMNILYLCVLVSLAQETKCYNGTGRCYWMLSHSDKTRDQARVDCKSHGDLAVMETEQLWDFVLDNFK